MTDQLDRIEAKIDYLTTLMLEQRSEEAITISVIAERLRARALELGLPVTGDGRVSTKSAETLLCLSDGYINKLCDTGKGPGRTWRGMGGCRYSFYFEDLAQWNFDARDAFPE